MNPISYAVGLFVDEAERILSSALADHLASTPGAVDDRWERTLVASRTVGDLIGPSTVAMRHGSRFTLPSRASDARAAVVRAWINAGPEARGVTPSDRVLYRGVHRSDLGDYR